MAAPLSQSVTDEKIVFTYAPLIFQSAGSLLNNLLSINGIVLSNLTAFSDGILVIPPIRPESKKCRLNFKQQTYVRIALNAGGFVTLTNKSGQSNSFVSNPGQEYITINGAVYQVPITDGDDSHYLDYSPKTITFPANGFLYRGGIAPDFNAASWPPAAAATHVLQVYITPSVEIY